MNITRTIFIALLFFVAPNISSAGTQTFTSSGSFSVPAGVTSLTVDAIGGGGAGGGGTNEGAGGGGGGGGRSTETFAVTSGQVLGVTVGSGGGHSGAPHCEPGADAYAIGGSGGLSSVGSVTAYGGVGGSGQMAGGGGGRGSTSNGSRGGNAPSRWSESGGAGGASGSGATGGAGGTNAYCKVSGWSGSDEGAYWVCFEMISSVQAQSGSAYGGGGGGVGRSGTCEQGYFISGGAWVGPTYAGNGAPGVVTVSWANPGTINVASNISSSWTITGPSTITGSGTSQSSASPPGTYTITWGSVPGYVTPATQSLTLASDRTITFDGAYVASTCPAADSASWRVGGASCTSGAYGPLTSGSSITVASTNGNTGNVTLVCTNGEISQTNPSCAIPSATLSGSNCTIALGTGYCAAPFTWVISNATSPNLFNATNGTQYTTAPSGTDVSFAVAKGNSTVQARDGTTVLKSTSVVGTCAPRTVWDGSICAAIAPPTVSISVSKERISVGGSTTISWSTTDVTSCTVTKNGALFSSALASTGMLNTGITIQTEYKIVCEGGDGSVGNTATALVNVDPSFGEF